MTIAEHSLDVGDQTLNYAVGPENGPPLLLLHGVTRRWQSFMPVLSDLMMRWHVHALDFRGHGKSTRVSSAYRVVNYVDDAVAMLEHVIPSPAVLYGHSLGAMVAARTAALHPERVRAAALEDPPMHSMGERIAQGVLQSFFCGMEHVARDGGSLTEMTRRLANVELDSGEDFASRRLGEIRDHVSLRFTASCLQQLDPNVFPVIIAGNWLDAYPIEDTFRSLACPVLLMQADPSDGGMLIDRDAKLIADLTRECLHVRFRQVPHLIHWAQPTDLLRTLLAFLETVRD